MSDLDALSETARAELVKMTPAQVRELSFDVHIAQMHARQASYPSEPAEALSAMSGLVRKSVQVEVDDAVHHVMSTLLMLRLALLGGDEVSNNLDQIDLRALVYFVDDAIRVLHHHDGHMTEVCDRIRQGTHPLKK
jgi:hypothetical protein